MAGPAGYAGRELLVVKLGGTTLAEQRAVLEEVASVSATHDLVIVHGGGKRVTEWLARLDVETRFEAGLRVTDDRALEVAVAVLRGVVNTELVATLRNLGADAVGLSGVDGGLLIAERIPSLGRVATVVGARPTVLYALFAAGKLPVVAPLATDENGIVCNVNADEVAAGLAAGLHARLILLTDADGVRGADGKRIPSLDAAMAERLIEQGVIGSGMVPKVRSGLRALALAQTDELADSAAGARASIEVVIADGAAPAALSRALDDPSFGTRLRAAAGRAPDSRGSRASGG
ncbi:MAG: UDP-N-acetylmuramoyl-L-alanyl-D-glutamate-L-lysine ligase [Chloroflexota bacterium]|jgi:acetylglutamate kinase|nr:UDP-N-acetylmuramoyl-L-alanyl-D-glutamate-L-lysine ligase [Chloroflexota bacterium]